MNGHKINVHDGNTTAIIHSSPEQNLLDALRSAGLWKSDAPCGGHGTCGKCLVKASGAMYVPGSGEKLRIDGNILACRYVPDGDISVWLDTVVDDLRTHSLTVPGDAGELGLAIDLGTTAIYASLYDLNSRKRLDTVCVPNQQCVYGADVVSRIECCRKGKLNELLECTSRQLKSLVNDPGLIRKVVIVGNTVMEHLAARMDPSPLAVPPFHVRSFFGEWLRTDIWPNADVYFGRCLSAYVGGDITAGMLACEYDKRNALQLYIDIGTNGEIALGGADSIEVCATAAGPAFEGAEITCGMQAVTGAVDSVSVSCSDISAHVIGDAEPKGICGSGLIDAVAALLKLNLIGRSGRLISPEKAPATLRSRFIEVDGIRAFSIAGSVYLTVHDIHALTLAKAAIRAGIDTLLHGRNPDEIIIAGSFGEHMSIENAAKIGLLPPLNGAAVRQVGNSAFAGAAMLLNFENTDALDALAAKCSYIDLSSSDEFYENYISNLNYIQQ